MFTCILYPKILGVSIQNPKLFGVRVLLQFCGGDIVQTDRIRTKAKECGRSLSYLCRALGVTNGYFVDIERQNRNIPREKLDIIAVELNTTPEYLSYKTDDPNPKEKEPVEALDEVEAAVLEILRTMTVEEKLDLIEYLKRK